MRSQACDAHCHHILSLLSSILTLTQQASSKKFSIPPVRSADTAADSVRTLTTRDAATTGVRARPPIGGDPSPPPHRGRHGLVALATGPRTDENLGHRFWAVLTPRIELHEEPLG